MEVLNCDIEILRDSKNLNLPCTIFFADPMSTGIPKEALQNVTLAVHSTTDMCKGCRKFMKNIIKFFASTKIMTAIITLVPMISVISLLIFIEASLYTTISSYPEIRNNPQAYQYKTIIFTPLYILCSIVLISGAFGLLAIYCEFQNLLRTSAFLYTLVTHWLLMTIVLVVFPVAQLLPLYIIQNIFLWTLIPSILFLFTASVMSSHADLVTEAIYVNHNRLLQV